MRLVGRRRPGLFVTGLLAIVMLAGGRSVGAAQGDGSLDPAFGTAGRITLDLGDPADQATALAAQPDGKLVVAGAAAKGDYTAQPLTLLRFNPDGSLDPAFGAAGIVRTMVRGADKELSAQVYALTLQPDGKIVAVGQAYDPIELLPWMLLARFNADGSFDSGFGSGGVVLKQINTFSGERATSVGIAPDGAILVAGESNSYPAAILLLRYNAAGTPDYSFGQGGLVFGELGGDARVNALLQQPDGKIILGGSVYHINDDFLLLRYNADGSPDQSFGLGGRVESEFLSNNDAVYGLALRPDGKIVAGGTVGLYCANCRRAVFGLAQYNPDGSIDESFGEGGQVFRKFGEDGTARALAFARRADGRLVLAGSAGAGDMAVALYDANGTLDGEFGVDGVALARFGGPSEAYALALQPDGQIVAAGRAAAAGPTPDFDLALARFGAPPDPAAPADCMSRLAAGPLGDLFYGAHLRRYACRGATN